MPVPDMRHVPQKLFDTGLFDLRTHEGQGAFVDAVISALHALDEHWGHLKKNPGQTDVHGHAEDAALYLSDETGQSQSVDFVGGAGGPNPRPAWQVDAPRYSKKDWLDPTKHGTNPALPPPPPPPPLPQFPYPDENTAGKAYQARVKQAFKDAGRAFPDPNDEDAFRLFMRFGYSSHEMPAQQAADKHVGELRGQLGV
jgi:hypothetical protein